VFAAVATLAFFALPLSTFVNTPHDVTRADLAKLRADVEREGKVVFFARETYFFFNFLPEQPAFLLDSHPTSEEVARQGASTEGVVRLFSHVAAIRRRHLVDSRGLVRGAQGEIYAGNLSSFCQALALYPDFKVVF